MVHIEGEKTSIHLHIYFVIILVGGGELSHHCLSDHQGFLRSSFNLNMVGRGSTGMISTTY